MFTIIKYGIYTHTEVLMRKCCSNQQS